MLINTLKNKQRAEDGHLTASRNSCYLCVKWVQPEVILTLELIRVSLSHDKTIFVTLKVEGKQKTFYFICFCTLLCNLFRKQTLINVGLVHNIKPAHSKVSLPFYFNIRLPLPV